MLTAPRFSTLRGCLLVVSSVWLRAESPPAVAIEFHAARQVPPSRWQVSPEPRPVSDGAGYAVCS